MGGFTTLYATVDLEANGGLGAVTSSGNEIQVCVNKFASAPLAVSKPLANGNRYLYTLSLDPYGVNVKVKKHLVSSTGINYVNTVYSGSEDLIPAELELSHDGTKLAMANSEGNNVLMLHLDPVNGDLVGSAGNNGNGTSDFIIPNSTNLRGVEFSPSGNNLFVSSKSIGVVKIDILGNSVGSPLIQSEFYSNSDLEMAYDPNGNYKIYGVHDNGTNLGAISNLDLLSSNFTSNAITGVNVFSNGFPTGNFSTYDYKFLPKTIDGEDYVARFQNSTSSCCVVMNEYDVYRYTAQSNGTWLPAGNPINNQGIITIENELRIPQGKTITIKNMILKFAPGARLVIENGTTGFGGKLILDSSTLTVDNRCGANLMWLGVEVWGNQSQPQVSFGNSNQGRIEIKNQSKIEHAIVGVLLSRRNEIIPPTPGVPPTLLNTFNTAYDGGIVQSTNSFFYGNKRGVWFQPYVNGAINNLSQFVNNEFKWNGALLDPNEIFHSHVQMDEVYGVRFLGNDFLNLQPGSQPTVGSSGDQGDGYGIFSLNSQFFVDSRCASAVLLPVGTPCPNVDKNKFTNLYMGIAASSGSNRTFRCDKSIFSNCRYGIYVKGTRLERITRNDFFVRENDGYQTAGLVMYNSTGYIVQENNFDLFDSPAIAEVDGNTYGIVVNNSGTDNNDIYNNTFKNLLIGGQSERINAIEITGTNQIPTIQEMSGLTWTCNKFISNIRSNDLTVVNGRIDYYQGFLTEHNNNLEGIKNAAKNEFSLVGEDFNSAHDIGMFSSQKIQYNHLYAPNHTPDSYTLFYVYPAVLTGTGGYPIAPSGNYCPSKLDVNPIVIKSNLIVKKDQLKEHKNKMSGGNSSTLIELIQTENNPNTVKSALISKSPFLPDYVLIAYLNSSASASMKKEVLLANTRLSQLVLDEVYNSNLPIGTKNQIYSAQTGQDLKAPYYIELSKLQGEYDDLFNDLMSNTILDYEDSETNQAVIDLSSELGDQKSKRIKVQALIEKGDVDEAEILRQELLLEFGPDEELELIRIQKDIRPNQGTVDAIENQPLIGIDLENLRDNSTDAFVRRRAGYQLELRDGFGIIPEFLPLINSSAMLLQDESTEDQIISSKNKVVSIYPNPSNGIVYFDYPNHDEGILSVRIIELSGKKVYSYTSDNKSNGERVDLSSINSGMYLVEISIDNSLIEIQKLQLK
jgi:hypothetical protein